MGTKEIVSVIVFSSIFLIAVLCFLWSTMILQRRRANKYIQDKVQMESLYAQELLKSQLEIQEQTFRSISQEIHDNIGQILSLAKLNLAVLNQETGSPMLVSTRELVTKAITDLRDLSKGLSPERVAEVDLDDSIRQELQILEKTNLYATSFKITGSVYPLEKEQKIILFRIFQEVVNNIVKHAGANAVNVNLDYHSSFFVLMITDNGSGFDPDVVMDGIGLRNIRNRSELLGATLKIDSGSQGTLIYIRLPVVAELS